MKNKLAKHLGVLFILVALVIIINAKIFFSDSPNLFLLVYGITVTSGVFLTFLISLKYVDPSEELRRNPLNMDPRKPFVSCVLAVRNEEKIITKCIDSLVNSDYENKEIIIVDDASTDNTLKLLHKYEKMSKIKIIHLSENVGKKKAISQGLRVARGEIFVFTDSDCVVAPDAISRIIEVLVAKPNVGAVSGHGRALNSNQNILTKIQDSWYETQYSVKKACESVYGAVTCVSGPLAVFRRSAIYNYIPAWENDSFLGDEFKFATDRQLTGYVLGSKYVGAKLKNKYANSSFVREENYPVKAWDVIYCKSAKVLTVVPDTWLKVVRQHIRWKKSFIRNLFFTGAFYWKKPIVPATRYYLNAIFVLVGPFIALRHLVYLPLNGNINSALFYLGGIIFMGSLYGLMYKIENPKSHLWLYRPLMSIMSTMLLSWLIFYSIFTIKKSVWHR